MNLHIGEEQTTAQVPAGDAITLAVGWRLTARHWWRHDPPSALELENAIMGVEDEVMKAVPLIAPGGRLVTSDAAIRQIALLAGVSEASQMLLGLDAMEGVFDRFSAIVQGRPPSQDVLPAGHEFAATLLILREFMHHLKFAGITVQAGGSHPVD